MQGFRFRVGVHGFTGSGFRVQSSGFMVQGSGFRVQGSGSLHAELRRAKTLVYEAISLIYEAITPVNQDCSGPQFGLMGQIWLHWSKCGCMG